MTCNACDPTLDATDGACPCWWRGHDRTAQGMAEALERARAELRDAELLLWAVVKENGPLWVSGSTLASIDAARDELTTYCEADGSRRLSVKRRP